MHIKLLILGITGNLAQLKIIPAVAQFAERLSSDHTIELIGYSRSSIDYNNLIETLNRNTRSKKHNLTSVTLYNGEYTNNSVYHSLIQSLQENERLWVYLAVPPSIYIPFLQQSCPYSKHPILILVEKPFGTNLAEMTKIKAVVDACDLHQRVLFVDHYLFKSGLALAPSEQTPLQDIELVEVAAYETLGIEDRLGYYAEIGALKDMLPHLLSVLQYQLRQITEVSLAITDLQIDSINQAQYAEAQQVLPITTPTFFRLRGKVQIKDHIMDVILSSGKRLHTKQTYSVFHTKQGKIRWELAPESKIEYESHTISEINTLTDHTRLFDDALAQDFRHFLDVNEAHRSVVLEEKAVLHAAREKKPLDLYQSGIDPALLTFTESA